MLNFDGNWRFDSPGAIAPGAVEGFFGFISQIVSQFQTQKLTYEFFKQRFAGPANEQFRSSSNLSFAEGNLRYYMEKAAANAPLFIEAFYDGCERLRQLHPNLAVPDVRAINRVLYECEAGYEIRPPDLISRNPQAPIPVPVHVPSLHQQARDHMENSLAESQRLLSEGRDRQAVQEILWLLETVSTAFRGIDLGEGTVKGKYFNKIVDDLKRFDGGDLKMVLEWITALHGYLSSPTGGGVRHGVDLAANVVIRPNEARLFCNLARSYIVYLIAEHERLTGRAPTSAP
jgi:hypothetical protein